MTKHQLYEVQFGARITLAASSKLHAVSIAAAIIDNPIFYITQVSVVYAYPAILDLSTLVDPPKPQPAPEVDFEPLPF